MQRTDLVLRRLYFGYNPTALCFRLEARSALGPYDVSLFLVMEPSGFEQLSLPLSEGERPSTLLGTGPSTLLGTSPPARFGANWRVDLLPGRGATVGAAGE